MSVSYIVIALLVGWYCGNEPRFPWWLPKPPTPPDPEPWWRTGGVGAVGGVAGGFLAAQVFSNEALLVAVSIGAFVGGRVFVDFYRLVGLPYDPIPIHEDKG